MADSGKKENRQRYVTGIAGLDEVLQGGFMSGSVYIIRGTPGAGKTILANQLCFNTARQQQQCLYVTLLSESHDRLIENIRGLDYYSDDLVEHIQYLSGFHVLEEEGLKGILRMLAEETKRYDACFVVLDGLFVLQEKINCERDFRLFMNQLQNLAHLTDSTMLLLTNSDRGSSSPEYTMVDGWLELAVFQHSYRVYRYLQVHKLRGSPFIDGQHALNISDLGMRILPRLESVETARAHTPHVKARLKTDVEGFDEMIGGGIPQASNTLLVGATGVGKTAFGLHFVSQSTPEEPGLIFGFYEGQQDLEDKAKVLGIHAFQKALDSGALEVMWHSPTEHVLDELAYKLIEAVQRRGVKRLFLDGIDGLRQSAMQPERVGRLLAALNNRLRAEGVTAMFTLETPQLVGGEAQIHFTALSSVAQNIVLLRYLGLGPEICRTVAVVKARISEFDSHVRKFYITEGGIKVRDPITYTGGVPSGLARSYSSEVVDKNE